MKKKKSDKVRNWFGKICVAIFKLFPIKQNRIYFISNYGQRYSCNPRAFLEYLYKNHKDEFEFYYCLNHKTEELPKDVKHHRLLSIADLYYLNTSKYIVNNCRFHYFFAKRKEQVYIQTWHGGPIMYKKFEKDAPNLPWTYTYMAKNDAQYIDILVAGSRQGKEVLDNCFFCDNKTVMTGNPRCDKLINPSEEERKRLMSKFGLDENDYVVLYAPTFRNNQKVVDSVLDNDKLREAFSKNANGKNVKILYRFHPNVAKESKKIKLEDYVLNVTCYPDIQDLILVSDVMITDYSSCMFDMMISSKPCIIYTNDDKKYLTNERGVYFPTTSLPFPVAFTFEELLDTASVLSERLSEYLKAVEKFLNDFGVIEDGKACERLYKEMKERKWRA